MADIASTLPRVGEQRQVVDALRESEERYRSIVVSTLDWIWEIDLDGHHTFSNHRLEAILGYSRDEFCAIVVFELFHPDDIGRVQAVWGDCIERRTGWRNLVIRMRGKDGEYRHLESTATPILAVDGDIVGFRGIDRDVTQRWQAAQERDQLNNQLQHALKMEAVGRLAAGVAHDFNNILTVICGNAELMSAQLVDEDPLAQLVDEIMAAGDSATSLTRHLLAFSWQQKLEPRVLDVGGVIEGVVRMLRRLLPENIELGVAGGEDLESVHADPGQIEQILVNLSINARDAMPDGGRLTLTTANVTLDEDYTLKNAGSREGDYVMIAVTDTGTGIPEQERVRVFEPFYTTKPQGKGTGLGLSVAYGIVKQSGGYIELASQVGRGTTLRIYLPRYEG